MFSDRLNPLTDSGKDDLYTRREFLSVVNSVMSRILWTAGGYEAVMQSMDSKYTLQRMTTPLRRRFSRDLK